MMVWSLRLGVWGFEMVDMAGKWDGEVGQGMGNGRRSKDETGQ